ncbi:alpha/beta fold hydrolase [Mycobacterium botniense]|uniref:alpha/beta fold hydrolase n=1 Tax=Mycobacterium botniense TaxID=84962 RepID=UPI0013D04506|nr:alpha/beta hydrolase [Mycobacterium botniense]
MTTRDGVLLSLDEYGSRDAVHTVVLLHGFCLTKESWALQTDHLLHRYGSDIRIISYDQRGHGDSASAPMHTYQIDQLADDLTDVLVATRARSPLTLVGHSMGGMAALAYFGRLEQRPVRPHGLVLVATAAGKLTQRGMGRLLANPGADILYQLVQHVPHAAAEHAARAFTRPICSALIRYGGYGSVDRDALIAASVAKVIATPVTTKAGFLRALRHHDQYRALSSITATTAVVSGGADKLTPPIHARELAGQIAEARHVHLPTAGHMLLDEVPHVISTAIIDVIEAWKTPEITRGAGLHRENQIPDQPLAFREAS